MWVWSIPSPQKWPVPLAGRNGSCHVGIKIWQVSAKKLQEENEAEEM